MNYIAGCLAAVGVIAFGVILQARQNRREKQRLAEYRQFWKKKFEEIADDLSTDPNGWSMDKVLDYLEEPEWQELYEELEKMPRGKRSLQRAIEICDREDYRRDPGKE